MAGSIVAFREQGFGREIKRICDRNFLQIQGRSQSLAYDALAPTVRACDFRQGRVPQSQLHHDPSGTHIGVSRYGEGHMSHHTSGFESGVWSLHSYRHDIPIWSFQALMEIRIGDMNLHNLVQIAIWRFLLRISPLGQAGRLPADLRWDSHCEAPDANV